MTTQLVPVDILKKADKILFIAHLAIGDFTYLQNCFKSFSEAYPHIKIHIWVDDVRRTSNAAEWEHLKKYVLYDWLEACPFFAKVYKQTYSPDLFQQSIKEARLEQYPLVVSLSTLRMPMYATLARDISPHGFVTGMKKKPRFFAFGERSVYKKLNATVNYDAKGMTGQHISDVYAEWFTSLFGYTTEPASRFPFVLIPDQWQQGAQELVRSWGCVRDNNENRQARTSGKLLFINSYAKTPKRCWPLEHVLGLVTALKQQAEWRDAHFVINVVPEEMAHATRFFANHSSEHIHLFSAQENFFQLPALLAQCDLILSVETAVMHLANAVHVPVIALMRQKNPEWAPVDKENSTVITASKRRDWVKEISVDQVVAAFDQYVQHSPNVQGG